MCNMWGEARGALWLGFGRACTSLALALLKQTRVSPLPCPFDVRVPRLSLCVGKLRILRWVVNMPCASISEALSSVPQTLNPPKWV